MFVRLLLAFILVPLIELFLLLKIADHTSVMATVLLVVATGFLGSYLAKREGSRAWRRFREATASGRMPGEELQDGLMIVFAAALLLTPGLLTDAVGFTLLLPAGRSWIRQRFFSRMFANVNVRWMAMDGNVVEGGVAGKRTKDSGSAAQDATTIEAHAVQSRAPREH